MKTRFTAVLALAVLIMTAATMLAAQEKEIEVIVTSGDEGEIECAAEAKLSAEQRTKLEELRMENRLRTIELRADLAKLGAELKRETAKGEPDMKAVEAVLKKMSAVRERIQMNRIEHDLAMKKLLGDDWRMHVRPARGAAGPMWIEAEKGEGFERGDRMAASPRAKMGARPHGGAAMMKRGKGASPKMCHPALEGRGRASMRCRSVRKACSGSCAAPRSNWESRMFRPRGKKTAHRCSDDCRRVERRHEMPDCGRMMKGGGR